MVLIDTLLSYNEDSALAEFTIKKNHIFADDSGNVPSLVGIEMMAQTIAAFAGSRHKKNKEEIRPGFLIGSRIFESFIESFSIDKTYIVQVIPLFIEETLGSFDCTISDKNTNSICLKARLNVYEPGNKVWSDKLFEKGIST